MPNALASIAIDGLKSIKSLELDISSGITLLIGANGAGKSNLVDGFEVLGYAVDQSLQKHLVRNGGFSQLINRSPGSTNPEQISIQVWSEWNGSYRNGYRLSLSAGRDDSAVLEETTYLQGAGYTTPYAVRLGFGQESRLRESLEFHTANQYLFDALSGCRVFHFDDTSFSAPPLRRTDIADSETLHSDARNLAAVLLDMQVHHSGLYDNVVRSVRNVAPFFGDFVLRPEGDFVILRWREAGLDDVFSGGALSSGTLRFICLSVLLQQPRPAATIVLDEPELGLHPAAIFQLADLFRNVGRSRRIVAATQSVTLLSQFGIDEVAVVQRKSGGTTVDRPDRKELEAWLSEYSLGELWEMNLLGGRPGASGQSGMAR